MGTVSIHPAQPDPDSDQKSCIVIPQAKVRVASKIDCVYKEIWEVNSMNMKGLGVELTKSAIENRPVLFTSLIC